MIICILFLYYTLVNHCIKLYLVFSELVKQYKTIFHTELCHFKDSTYQFITKLTDRLIHNKKNND